MVLPIDALKKDVTGKVVHRDGRGCVRDEHVPLPAHRRLQIQAPATSEPSALSVEAQS